MPCKSRIPTMPNMGDTGSNPGSGIDVPPANSVKRAGVIVQSRTNRLRRPPSAVTVFAIGWCALGAVLQLSAGVGSWESDAWGALTVLIGMCGLTPVPADHDAEQPRNELLEQSAWLVARGRRTLAEHELFVEDVLHGRIRAPRVEGMLMSGELR